jgi:hypothetical protein
MIGVIGKPEQSAVVEEFFELFKTPWEPYQHGRSYEVLVATTGEIPDVHGARFLLLCGPVGQAADVRYGISPLAHQRGGWVSCGDERVPIYGDLLAFAAAGSGIPVVASDAGITGVRFEFPVTTVIRLGYDLFDETRALLSAGQPAEHASMPSLDLHIEWLRRWILGAGVELLEIPPMPAGHSFSVCLTHDIDFVGIRHHLFDHSMCGFLYRSTVGALWNLARGRVSVRRLLRIWQAVLSLPFVLLGWMNDFWEPFDWYLRVEQGLPATYFLIPFKKRAGERLSGPNSQRRATAYDITDIPDRAALLVAKGCEVGVHGIDAWHSSERGRAELTRIVGITGASNVGIRMHWLLQDGDTASVLDDAGYAYDSTGGYNDTVGYRYGTTQVFRPLGGRALRELSLHIQDGALFFPDRLDLPEDEAWSRCMELIARARQIGGVLTVLWHDRSHGPERFWGDFYVNLVDELRSLGAWFATAAQAVGWFEKRRASQFVRTASAGIACVTRDGGGIDPPLRLRVHHPGVTQTSVDVWWDGVRPVEFDSSLRKISPQMFSADTLPIPLASGVAS